MIHLYISNSVSGLQSHFPQFGLVNADGNYGHNHSVSRAIG